MDTLSTSEHVENRGNPQISELGKATRWQPGISPNPGGRPKSKPVTEAYNRIGLLTSEEFSLFKPATMFEVMALKMFVADGQTMVPAVREITNRIEGSVDANEANGLQVIVNTAVFPQPGDQVDAD
jgi:hypothetical protein